MQRDQAIVHAQVSLVRNFLKIYLNLSNVEKLPILYRLLGKNYPHIFSMVYIFTIFPILWSTYSHILYMVYTFYILLVNQRKFKWVSFAKLAKFDLLKFCLEPIIFVIFILLKYLKEICDMTLASGLNFLFCF